VNAIEIHALVDEGLGNSAYVVEVGDGRALVVDPGRDPTPYLELDFVSGSRELAAPGARVVAARAANLQFPHHGMDDDEQLQLGGLTLRALATPGHAPEHLAWLLVDGGQPLALFSGGALLVGGVARTDLVSPEQTGPLTGAAWRSAQRLLELPNAWGRVVLLDPRRCRADHHHRRRTRPQPAVHRPQ
jgi:glyoxylase-like metal-dependent hydrolase (beta-lactamase superfamily II)